MVSLLEYFANNRYQAKYQFGERVFGYYNSIPFIGTVGSDSVRSELVGPEVTITLDLPIVFDNQTRYVILVKHKDIKRLKLFGIDEASKTSDSEFDSHQTHQSKGKPVLNLKKRSKQ